MAQATTTGIIVQEFKVLLSCGHSTLIERPTAPSTDNGFSYCSVCNDRTATRVIGCEPTGQVRLV